MSLPGQEVGDDGDDPWEPEQEQQPQDLDQNKRDHTAVDMPGCHFFWCNAAEVKQRKAKGWGQE